MYPVAYEADFVAKRSRLSTFFRLLLTIPWWFVAIFWGIGLYVCVVLAWFAIVVTGRYPAGLYAFVARALRFTARVQGFAYLMTDLFPPFDGGEHPDYPVRLIILPPLPRYSRWRTLLRVFLLIPVVIVLYLMGLLMYAISLLSWITIVVLGRQPLGLHDVLKVVLAYQARATAYYSLVTETYPPLSVEDGAPPPATDAPAVTYQPPRAG